MASAMRSAFFGFLLAISAVFLWAFQPGCDDDASDGDADGDSDGDSDGDTDGDSDGDSDEEPSLMRLTAEDFQLLLETEAPALINVHIPYAGQIPGTDTHITYTDIEALVAFIGSDLDAPVALYCLSGPMSVSAGEALAARGYSRIHDLIGGMNAWRDAGFPLED